MECHAQWAILESYFSRLLLSDKVWPVAADAQTAGAFVVTNINIRCFGFAESCFFTAKVATRVAKEVNVSGITNKLTRNQDRCS